MLEARPPSEKMIAQLQQGISDYLGIVTTQMDRS